MPIRTYTNTDFINYIAGFLSNLADVAAIATPTGNFNVSVNATGSHDTAGHGNSSFTDSDWEYEASGQLDFDAFPSIPDNAQISKVEVQCDVEISGTSRSSYTSDVPGAGATSTTIEAHISIFKGADILGDLSLDATDSDGVSAASPKESTINAVDHYTAVQEFDFTGAEIDKAALIAGFTNWSARLLGTSFSTAQSFGPTASQHSECNVTTRIVGLRVTVTYESGPIVINLTPGSGNVEIGQNITATGPGASELNYAALINNKVVPIEPKIISEDEVSLEIPYPSSDPCFDCFGDCPECDTCLDACSEDLESDACVECMQACMDCLVACLEDLQEAEECQNSTGTQGTINTVITIIATGTQFSGSVVLGSFTIIVANGSGLYRFTLGKTNDTIYAAERDGTTYDVKIPNPGGTTGFFRG